MNYLDRVLERIRYPVENLGWSIEDSLKNELRVQKTFKEIRQNLSLEDELMIFQAYDAGTE